MAKELETGRPWKFAQLLSSLEPYGEAKSQTPVLRGAGADRVPGFMGTQREHLRFVARGADGAALPASCSAGRRTIEAAADRQRPGCGGGTNVNEFQRQPSSTAEWCGI